MRWSERLEPTRMRRVAIVAPIEDLRAVLVAVADAGVVEIERVRESMPGPMGEALERARRVATASVPEPRLSAERPDLADLERSGRLAELAGEAEVEAVSASAVHRDAVAALVGWSPATVVAALAVRLAALGGAIVPLAAPTGVEPPTLVERRGATGAFQPLVDTYSTLPYADVNPSVLAGIAYVVMFGMMFGDLGDGALVLAGGLFLAAGRPKALVRLRRLAPFVIGAGLASMGFGLAFGEFFGPTHLVPTLWLAPLDRPTTLIAVAIGAGAGLLAVSYLLGTVNRFREGGLRRALLANSGLAGSACYVGLAVVGLGWYEGAPIALVAGGVLAAVGVVLGFLGSYLGAAVGGAAAQASVEEFDAVLRILTNTVSFARLAAFGLAHAALLSVVWTGTTGLVHHGPGLFAAAIALFLVGNAFAFALEGLVAGVQALRLEYYEMFSRIFISEGHRFRPWHVASLQVEEA
jgi:V/A-type H+/Na+-transporting ATPase subunit I